MRAMAENVDQWDVVPPSPVATSTQISHPRGNLPFLPRLPSLDLELDLNASLPSTSALSPIATVYAGQRNRGQSDQGSSQGRANSTGGFGIQDWVIRGQWEASGRGQSQQQPAEEVIEVDDDNSRSSGDSDVISIGEGSSDIQHVSDSDNDIVEDDDDTVVSRPTNPVPPDDPTDVTETGTSGGEVQGVAGPTPGPSDQPATDTGTDSIPLVSVTPVATPGPSVAATAQVVQILGAPGQSPADFRTPKRKRVHSPEKSSACGDKKDEEVEEEESECCPICFETWTTSGLHRLCSLKCGHLFGQSCIEKWLKGQGGKCPHCNAKAKRQDIRVLYAKSVKALDTTELDRAVKDLEKEREGKRRAEMEGAQLRLQYQMAVEENNKLKLELESLKSQLRMSGASATATSSFGRKVDTSQRLNQSHIAGQYLLDRTIKIWDAGNCRVMAYSPSLATIVASQPSSSPLFPGFGIKKICTLDFKTSQYLTIHSKAIRDVAFHPSVEDGMLLSCGLDKKVKMTSLLSNTVVQSVFVASSLIRIHTASYQTLQILQKLEANSMDPDETAWMRRLIWIHADRRRTRYDTPMPAWSCVWNAEDRNYFYAGLQNGLVLEFDIRNTDSAVQEFNREGSRSPVASLCFMCRDMRADFRSGGLLIGQLDRVSFFERLPSNQHKLHLLPLEGSLTSLHVDPNTRHVLASYRPAGRHPTIRHQLCELFSRNISTDSSVINNVCSCNVIHTFHGGRTQTILSKTIVQQHPADTSRLLVCAGDETNNSVHLWDSGTGQLAQRLITGAVTVDMCSFSINNTTYLAALTDKQCKVFKWT